MNKIFHIGSTFKSFEEGDELLIRGMASTNDTDRVGDIIEAAAWTKGGLNNYLNNPVILFNHDYNQPIGRAVELSTGDNGLQLKAKIAKSAGHVRELIKEGVLGAFSVGFRVKDAEYLKESDGYRIKDAELLEISVVTVPANQAATFSLAKSFNSDKEYEDFKKSLKEDSFVANESVDFVEVKAQEKTMSDIDINAIVAAAVEKTATAMAMKEAEKKAEEQRKTEAAKKAAEEAVVLKTAEEARIVSAVQSGAERLLADVEKKFADKDADHTRIINELQGELKEKSEEIRRIQDTKRVFANRGEEKGLAGFAEEAKDAYIYGIISRKGFDTRLGRELMQKVNTDAGITVPSAAVANFETQISSMMEQDIQLELVLDPLFRKITMNAANMVVPTLPDSGYAEFNNTAGSGSGSAPNGNLEKRGDTYGSPYTQMAMGSKTLTALKIVSKSYIANEVEEDAIIPVLSYIRDAIVRSHARAIEQSILMGNHASGVYTSGAYAGLAALAVADNTVSNFAGGSPTASLLFKASDLLDMRQLMGKYGRNPADLVYIVSMAAYYDLLDDAAFADVNQIGTAAIKVTGQVGSVYGTPIIVSDEFPTGGTRVDGAFCAIAVNTRNFVVPVLRGVTLEQDYDVENQRRVLVATQRRGFDRLFASVGQVVAKTW